MQISIKETLVLVAVVIMIIATYFDDTRTREPEPVSSFVYTGMAFGISQPLGLYYFNLGTLEADDNRRQKNKGLLRDQRQQENQQSETVAR